MQFLGGGEKYNFKTSERYLIIMSRKLNDRIVIVLNIKPLGFVDNNHFNKLLFSSSKLTTFYL